MRRSRLARLAVAGGAVALATMGALFLLHPTLLRDLIYMARPIWDKPPPGWTIIDRYGDACEAYGWRDRGAPGPRKVYDAIPLTVELDMLELRLRELWDVVDAFVVVESNTTFVGNSRPLVLQPNLGRFAWAREKLRYHVVTHVRLPGDSVWDNERRMRVRVQQALESEGVRDEDLVINSDADEIPDHRVVDILRRCDGAPPVVHLALREYLYSFEFPREADKPVSSWRASVKLHGRSRSYTHSRSGDHIFAAAGWHCSFCFRSLDDFRFKMTSYSHSDRLKSLRMLENDYLMRKICTGEDIFGILPEEFTFRELFYALGPPRRSHDFSGVPRALLENRDRFAFLLPGGRNCTRYVN
ncbi:hypothetical protein H4R18_001641 [Coemansia javaensis]|uniref:Uncharacterized protein n=1 Tax=Coemansia javaensis TaxID=2761396 RepID=A0A9W8HGJ2_9FUNG|nr:hypothetical protein H4R18_001641 [Coemansia javaensis]